jgi:FkbM family methyltransferase
MKYIIETYLPHLCVNGVNAQVPDLLAALPNDKKIILYGAGALAEAVLNEFEKDTRFAGFCDGNVNKQETGFHGWAVISPLQLSKNTEYSVVISTWRNICEIQNMLKDMNYPQENIYDLMPYVPRVDEKQYFDVDFLKFGEEVFVDAGCNELESTIELMNKCDSLKKVYAVEPDEENYKKCQINKEKYHLDQVQLFCKGTWSTQTQLCFDASHDVASHVSDDGMDKIDVIAIDDVVDSEDEITYIKMDIEGSELEALRGAEKTIRRCRPKLAICIYHKPEDMIEIPLYIKELVPDYKLYVRHHSSDVWDTVLYAKL